MLIPPRVHLKRTTPGDAKQGPEDPGPGSVRRVDEVGITRSTLSNNRALGGEGSAESATNSINVVASTLSGNDVQDLY
jgi:hypothetical protein